MSEPGTMSWLSTQLLTALTGGDVAKSTHTERRSCRASPLRGVFSQVFILSGQAIDMELIFKKIAGKIFNVPC